MLKITAKIGYFFMYLYASLLFMLSAIVISFPIRLSTKRDITQSIERIRRIYKLWIRVYFALVWVRLRIHGAVNEDITKQYIITPNHRSFFDILAITPNFKRGMITIGKDSFGKVPFFAWIYKSGAILVNRKNTRSRVESFQKLRVVLEKGISVCIYPEGTRNRGKHILYPFQTGAFRLSYETKTPILPVIIENSDKIMPVKGLFFRPYTIHIHILPPISVESESSPEMLKKRTFEVMHDFLIKRNSVIKP